MTEKSDAPPVREYTCGTACSRGRHPNARRLWGNDAAKPWPRALEPAGRRNFEDSEAVGRMDKSPRVNMIAVMTRVGAAVALAGGALLLANRRPEPRPATTVPAAASGRSLARSRLDDSIVFAGGCFWGVQAVFEHVRGVKSAVSGYAGGTVTSPSYEDVSSGTTGHAESVEVVFDASQVSLGQLLEVFFSVAHDPTQKNRQVPDVGTQYRSAIFYRTDEQRTVIDAYVRQLTDAKSYNRPIVTEVAPLGAFYPAEKYHQHYAMLHPDSPYIAMYDLPKVASLKARFATLYREDISSR